MPELNINVLLTFAAYAAITGLLNLLLSERSRVDAWAEAHPRVAAVLKLLRGLGLDPWHLVAAASLFFTKKLPTPPDDKGGSGGGSAGKDHTPTRIRFDRPNESFPPDEPAEMRRWPGLRATWAARFCAGVLIGHAIGIPLALALTGCSAFRSVTPADRAEAYAAQAKTAELACKAYVFDRAAGLTPEVPAMAKLCAGE